MQERSNVSCCHWLMDAIFRLGVQERIEYFRMLMQSLGCTYICMWSYYPHPNNCLVFYGGRYQEENDQPSSSSGSLARRLFDEYRQLQFFVVNDRVPGTACTRNRPYMEINEMELQRMAHVDTQLLFYQEARIKTAVFMGCRSGEIELGWSNVTQSSLQNEMRNWFPEVLSMQSPLRDISQAVDPNRPSSSSSSLRSLSMDSPDSSLLFNINPSTSHVPEALQDAPLVQPITISDTNPLQEAIQSLQPISTNTSTSPLQQAIQSLQARPSSTANPLQQAIQPLTASTSITRLQQPSIPSFSLTREREDAAMTRAILAVLTSPSSPSSSSTSTRNFPQVRRVTESASAFKSYNSGLAPRAPIRAGLRGQMSMIKRAITYYRSLNIVRREHMLPANRPTSTQLHHMISERKRREKINESFQALRSILPPDSKKDKASVLSRTREYLTNLKAQVAELSKRKEELEEQLFRVREAVHEATESSSGTERIAVRVSHVPESTSEQRMVAVQVIVRGEHPLTDMVIRILEFLKLDRNANLMSVEASRFAAESTSINRVILRLQIEGNEWDESAFQEALKRVLADLAQ